MSDADKTRNVPAPLVALAGWIVPGAGYWLIGHRARGVTVGVTVVLLFILGLLIAGIRVVDVPGYGDLGERVLVGRDGRRLPPGSGAPGAWALTARPIAEIAQKPWFVGQVLTGPISLISAYVSIDVSQPAQPGGRVSRVPRTHARLADIGTLYTCLLYTSDAADE